jgi:hypothetical protein
VLLKGLCFEAKYPLPAPNNNLAGSAFFWKSRRALTRPDLMCLPVQVPLVSDEIAARYAIPPNSFALGASPYIAFECLPEWRGGKILCALSQYTYWFLAVRADLGAVRGDMSALKGLRISASGQPGILLRKLLVDGGLDFERDKVQVVPAPRPPEGLDNLFEPPASEHLMSENASAAEPASLLAVFVADDGARLTVPSTP